ncbi:MAG: L,D-transpeptidase family protein [Chitinophagaceae bacterium]|nr:L,D-transpeptidase family protein [Chitinophagaceae bacterium]
MKKFIVALNIVIISLIACKNPTPYTGTAKKLTERNLSITKNNSYSDLFLDSLTVEAFIAEQKLSDTVANDMRSFYNSRNFQFAWFASDGLTEQAYAFNSLYDYTEDSARKVLDRKMDNLMIEENLIPSASDADIVKTELSLTWRFINYSWSKYPEADARASVLEGSVPAQKKLTLQAADEVLANSNANAANPSYDLLRAQLKKYADSIKTLPDTGMGRMLKDSLSLKIQHILVNMERMKWMPAEPKGELIIVNIPEFRLYVRNGNTEEFNMDVVVGKQGHNTVMFTGELNQVVFSPYWNLPPSIIKKEILPEMEKNSNYLQEKNMEVTGEENGLPVVRQLPGEHNDLGKVKFLFPNSFNIYFHDTPYKELFNKDKRAYSHGCIRLSDPVKMAQHLLKNQSEWTPQRIDSAMNSGEEKYVKVENPVRVMISYYTAWVDKNGTLMTAEDIYNHDAKLARKMFTDPKQKG